MVCGIRYISLATVSPFNGNQKCTYDTLYEEDRASRESEQPLLPSSMHRNVNTRDPIKLEHFIHRANSDSVVVGNEDKC